MEQFYNLCKDAMGIMTIIICANIDVFAEDSLKKKIAIHFQLTTVTQGHNNFSANYSGQNSLQTTEDAATSLTTTLFLSYHPFTNLHFILNPEIAGGKGLSTATGIAGFSNGECFRIGNATPTLYLARYVAEYYLNLNKEEKAQTLEESANQATMAIPKTYLKNFAGKFSLMDYFEKNPYNQDPRMQFLNWSFMTPGAWDYAADTRGYIRGVGLQFAQKNYLFTFAATQLPTTANGLDLDENICKAFALQGSWRYEKKDAHEKYKAHAEIILFYNHANMGNYEQAISANPEHPDITSVRNYQNDKKGFVINLGYQLNAAYGAYLKLGYNDGKNETWTFTEIDQSINFGLQYEPKNKFFGLQKMGAGLALNGISNDHKKYLSHGGYGFIIGDGKLNYGLEGIFETYCTFHFFKKQVQVSPDYQFVLNPAYNEDRGPVHIIGLRTHIEF